MAFKKKQPHPAYNSNSVNDILISERAGVEVNLERILYDQISRINIAASLGIDNLIRHIDMFGILLNSFIQRNSIALERIKKLKGEFKLKCENAQDNKGRVSNYDLNELKYEIAKKKYLIYIDVMNAAGLMPASKIEIEEGEVYNAK